MDSLRQHRLHRATAQVRQTIEQFKPLSAVVDDFVVLENITDSAVVTVSITVRPVRTEVQAEQVFRAFQTTPWARHHTCEWTLDGQRLLFLATLLVLDP